jgi:DNA-binding PadR family transcriptional regulator
MTQPKNDNQELDQLLPLPPAAFHILLSLARHENHGYAIMLDIEERTDGRFTLGPGTLYTSIKRMLKAGWIEESNDRPDPELDDERRRYYRLTGLGRRVTQAETERFSHTLELARSAGVLTAVSVQQGSST